MSFSKQICNLALRIVNFLLFSAVSFIKSCEIELGEKASILRVRQIKTTAGNINKFRWNLDSRRKSKKGIKKEKKKQSLDLVASWPNSKTACQEYFNYICKLNLVMIEAVPMNRLI